MRFLNSISIRSRLFLNLLISMSFLAAVSYVTWISLKQVENQSHELKSIQIEQTAKIAQFQQTLIHTTQLSNEYLLTLSQASNQKFNTAIDTLKAQAESLKTVLTSENHQQLIKQLQVALRQYKKATNSNVFLKTETKNTIEYGIEPTAKDLTLVSKELLDFAQENSLPEVNDAVQDLVARLNTSQLLLGKMISTSNIDFYQSFHQTGLGDSADKSISTLLDNLSGNFMLMGTLSLLEQSRDGYYESYADIKDYLTTTSDNNASLISLIQRANGIIHQLSTHADTQNIELIDQLTLLVQQKTQVAITIIAAAILLMLLLNSVIVSSIVQPLKQIQRNVLQISKSGRLNQWQPITGNNELVEMSHSLQQLITTFSQITDELMMAGKSLSEGHFHHKIEQDYPGDFDKLKNHFNQSIHEIALTMKSIQQMSQALQEGNLSFEQSNTTFMGDYRQVISSLQAAIQTQRNAIGAVEQVMAAMKEGKFSERIQLEMPGDMAQLKTFLNDSLDNLEAAINQKSTTLSAFREGNFSVEMNHQFKGKLNELRNNMDDMAEHVSNMLQQVKTASSEAVHGVREISAGNQDLSQRVNQQSVIVETTMNHMNEMIERVNNSLENATFVSQKSQSAKTETESGLVIVNQMADSINEISEASQQIADFTQVIDSIAFQTNLLALNAAVEAARAGEAGKGFAVVATEVRSLASKSAEAASHIRDITKKSLEKVQKGTELSELTRKSFLNNATAIDEISGLMIDMNESLKHQNQGIHEVNHSLKKIGEATQHNAALVEEVSHTSAAIIDSVQGVEDRLLDFKLRQAKPNQLTENQVIPLTIDAKSA
ncbi:hypothetical protein CYQ88_02805 [Hydrogenovibrio sp. SC-1]|uniref:methyl-accepting chemotaxis protein n=1 Tax=Hydrogenovibrio sp. SC-1 TaxID=2065820 RepID=UPI000C7A0C0C|nr:methyl-accepting chemotaxis protein [Hydrogenovibrio sp. SC-1]PLA75172.1 hypothetical protein CYQ88_02805 [Hydrogenovibrio sp. SC-1]